jgi:hypothetical protein
MKGLSVRIYTKIGSVAPNTAYTLLAYVLALRDIAPCGRNFVYPQTLYTIVRKANGLSHIDVEMCVESRNYFVKKLHLILW